jgi:hypothetical protein
MATQIVGGVALNDGLAIVANKNKDGRLEIFFIDDGGQLYNRYQSKALLNVSGWSDWVSLRSPKGGFLSQAAVSIISNADGHLEVFALGADGQLYHLQLWLSGWSDWVSLRSPKGGFLSQATVSIISNADGHLEVFALGADEQLYHSYQRNSDWSRWLPLGRP